METAFSSQRPAGGIYSNIVDVAERASLRFLADPSDRGGADVLVGSALKEMRRCRTCPDCGRHVPQVGDLVTSNKELDSHDHHERSPLSR